MSSCLRYRGSTWASVSIIPSSADFYSNTTSLRLNVSRPCRNQMNRAPEGEKMSTSREVHWLLGIAHTRSSLRQRRQQHHQSSLYTFLRLVIRRLRSNWASTSPASLAAMCPGPHLSRGKSSKRCQLSGQIEQSGLGSGDVLVETLREDLL